MAGYQTVAQRNLTCAIRIKERRKELGLTQAEVVQRVSQRGSRLSHQALSAIENGRRLAVGRLPDLADALDCTVTYLLGLTADPHRWPPDKPSGTAKAPDAPPRLRRLAVPDPVHPSGRSWILGPDVPDQMRTLPRLVPVNPAEAAMRISRALVRRPALPAGRRPGRHRLRFLFDLEHLSRRPRGQPARTSSPCTRRSRRTP